MRITRTIQRTALDKFLTNERVPRPIRKIALRAALKSGIGRRWTAKGSKPDLFVERHWRESPDNEPGEKRILAWRRKYPKPFPFFKEDLFDKVFGYINSEVEFVDGRWSEHWGDAALYGIVTDTLAYKMTHDPHPMERARASKRANMTDVLNAGRNPKSLIEQSEKSLMAALGLLLSYDDMPDWETIPAAIKVIRELTEIVELMGGYMDNNVPPVMDYYGRTTPSAMFFVINLFLADFYRRHDHPIASGKAVGTALRLLDQIRAKTFDPDGPRYLFAAGETRPYCFPNPIMIIGLSLLHELTGDPAALTEAEGVFGWLQNLKDEKNGGYWTPYVNRVRKGAYSLNIKLLSAQNYVLYASLYLYRVTRNKWYLKEMKSLLDFIEKDLYHDGLIWHEIEDGKRSDINSPEPYCVGCNQMTLYLLLQINYTERLGAKLIALENEEKERANDNVTPITRNKEAL